MPETEALPPNREWVYFLEAGLPSPVVKIGKSRALRWRMLTLQYMCPVPLRLIGAFSAPAGTEFVVHAKFKALRQHGEWFAKAAELAQFIEGLPKGESIPGSIVAAWVSETGVALKPRRSTERATWTARDKREVETSRYWAQAFRD